MSNNRVLEIDYTTPPSVNDVATFDGDKWIPQAGGGGGGGITIEQAQDAIGTILTNTTEIALVYDDATPTITANLRNGSIDEARLDASVNASLDLADSALQAADIGVTVQPYTPIAETEIDFGSTPQISKTFTVTDATVTVASKITTWPSGNTATDRVGNDDEWDMVMYSAKAGSGNFTLTAMAMPGPIVGKRKVYYAIG